MKAVDTNILIRLLTKDDELQAKKVYEIFKSAESEKTRLFVPLLVVLEVIWVLESVYNITRAEILDSINDMLLMPVLTFEALPALQQFIESAESNKYDLSDLLIAYSAKSNGCKSVITFDKKASKFHLFELL
ncbi:MAG: type II toxin-antitoxin system VapC family toxin [Desulfamplus sp.]|nr:type II toxin-antitoxin system VapC family toxin [Desulfamplus sp.]